MAMPRLSIVLYGCGKDFDLAFEAYDMAFSAIKDVGTVRLVEVAYLESCPRCFVCNTGCVALRESGGFIQVACYSFQKLMPLDCKVDANNEQTVTL